MIQFVGKWEDVDRGILTFLRTRSIELLMNTFIWIYKMSVRFKWCMDQEKCVSSKRSACGRLCWFTDMCLLPQSCIHFLFVKLIIPPSIYWYLRRLQRTLNVSSPSPTCAGLRQMLILTNYSSRLICAPFPLRELHIPRFKHDKSLQPSVKCWKSKTCGSVSDCQWCVRGLLMNDCTDKVAVVAHRSLREGGVTG